MCRLFFRCGCLVVFLVLVAGCGLLFVGSKVLLDTSNNFMSAIKDGNYQTAYSYLSSDLQKQLGNPEGGTWNFTSQPISSWKLDGLSVQNSQLQATGEVTFTNGQTGIVSVALGYIDNTWKIVGFSITPTVQ